MAQPVVFFSLLDGLGQARLAGTPRHLAGFTMAAAVPAVLERLRGAGIPFGFIIDLPHATVQDVVQILGTEGGYRQELIIPYAADFHIEPIRAFVCIARQAAAHVQDPLPVLVSGYSRQRQAARAAGWRVCPHPLLLDTVLRGEQLRYVVVSRRGSRKNNKGQPDAMPPVVLGHLPPDNGLLVGIGSQRDALRLGNAGQAVRFLGGPDLPLTTDLYLLRDDRYLRGGQSQAGQHFNHPATANWLLELLDGWLIVAVPGDRSIDEVHFEETRHGHALALCGTCLPQAVENRINQLEPYLLGLWEALDVLLTGSTPLGPSVLTELNNLTAAEITDLTDRLSGKAPPSMGGVLIESRYYSNRDQGNQRAVDLISSELAAALQGLGAAASVYLQPVSYGPQTFDNVVAEIYGSGNEVILLGAHLDSTAEWKCPPYPAEGKAPGADDNASGVAAVIAVAQRCAALAQTTTPRRTIRFVLFNLEESGMWGSYAHVLETVNKNSLLLAAINIDMIGYNADGAGYFEIHCGVGNDPILAGLQPQVLQLGEYIQQTSALVTTTNTLIPQLFPDPGVQSVGYCLRDPGCDKSDHRRFHQCGYVSCWITEDFERGPPPQTQNDMNPHYHKASDTDIDATFAADIARVLAGAVWLLATA